MDFEILPQLIMLFSTAGILVIVGKNFAKIKEREADSLFLENEKDQEEREKFVYLYKRAIRRINKENYEQKINSFWIWFEKLLRKIRISFLKLDHEIVELLEHLRRKNIKAAEEKSDEPEIEPEEKRKEENQKLLQFINSNRNERRKAEHEEKERENEMAAEEEKDTATKTNFSVAEGLAVVEENTEAETEEIQREELAYTSEPAEEVTQYQEEETEHETEAGENIETRENIGMETPENTAEEVVLLEVYEEEVIQESPLEEVATEAEPAYTEVKEEVIGAEENFPEETVSEEKDIEETEEIKKVRTKKEEEYIGALMKDPADVKSYWKLGLLYSKRRNYDDALACFKQIAKIDPTYTKAKQKAIELMDKMKRRGGDE
ncbi:MAG: tetratricopeptide repeat protein [Candidatus Pacebacteria bacterium]|nr:tetratricopeptide repeat protein [Candidatus Paceibacterota bacterium]